MGPSRLAAECTRTHRTAWSSKDGDDFVVAASYLKNLPAGNGKVGVVGFCYGGVSRRALSPLASPRWTHAFGRSIFLQLGCRPG
ncbi:hypothetical protein [Aquabacterium sp.]|uniref:hypothetical protein n=1 Tax=Aquabacterium sp. TaxID=1872578 RepID=UPI0024899E79|nr:hypothetical protein [Aquabacterium sp.]MDI1259198.1 hypothetical protein [Aquabacterium sp.]